MVIDMLLKEIYSEYDYNIEITGVQTDSRFVKPGNLFLPIRGKNFEGDEFFIDAITKGAVAIVYDKAIHNLTIPVIIVDNLEKELFRLIDLIYEKPYNELTMIGVTGTDGKTSVSTLTSYLLNHLSRCANIGTNGIIYDKEIIDNVFTTPILTQNYSLLREFSNLGISYVSMEVSSQGIANKRIEGILYDYAIFTNLSHEHLDTHKTMHNYFLTKLKLFKQLKKQGIMLVNKDDYYAKFFEKYSNVIYYSLFSPSDYQAIHIRYYQNHTVFDLKAKDFVLENLRVNRTEEYNIYNILPAIIIALKEGLDVNLLYELLLDLPIIPGRLEKVPVKYPFDVYIDFAHTPNALKNVLSALRKKAKRNIILVCGAAGNKDKTKRPLMGNVATEYADYTIFTSEDPRLEDPNDIIKEMTKMIDLENPNYKIIINRQDALSYAFKIAKKDDIILVTGKGRENFFEENNIIYPYSDFDYLLDIKI